MAYIYLGYGTTDNNGKAKLEYDPNGDPLTHSYTGTGAGEIDIIASLDDEITETSIISNRYIILDGTFLDKATTGNKNTNWTLGTNITASDPTDTGTKLTNTSGTRQAYVNSSSSTQTLPLIIEVDIVEYTGTVGIQYSASNSPFIFPNKNLPDDCHLKLIIGDGAVQYQINNGTLQTHATGITATTTNIAFRFVGAGTITYRNFITYPTE